MQPQGGSLTLGNKLEVIGAHKNGMSFADIGKRFQIPESVIQTPINLSSSLTRSEKKFGTRDHPSFVDKPLILHLLSSVANLSKVCTDFSISKNSLYRYKKNKGKHFSMEKKKVWTSVKAHHMLGTLWLMKKSYN